MASAAIRFAGRALIRQRPMALPLLRLAPAAAARDNFPAPSRRFLSSGPPKAEIGTKAAHADEKRKLRTKDDPAQEQDTDGEDDMLETDEEVFKDLVDKLKQVLDGAEKERRRIDAMERRQLCLALGFFLFSSGHLIEFYLH